MIWRGVEGNIIRNGLTIFYPNPFIVLKLTRRFVLQIGRWGGASVRLTIDTQRDHSMYRAADMDTPSLMCRNCDIWHDIMIQYVGQLVRNTPGPDDKPTLSRPPAAFCSGKFYQWER